MAEVPVPRPRFSPELMRQQLAGVADNEFVTDVLYRGGSSDLTQRGLNDYLQSTALGGLSSRMQNLGAYMPGVRLGGAYGVYNPSEQTYQVGRGVGIPPKSIMLSPGTDAGAMAGTASHELMHRGIDISRGPIAKYPSHQGPLTNMIAGGSGPAEELLVESLQAAEMAKRGQTMSSDKAASGRDVFIAIGNYLANPTEDTKAAAVRIIDGVVPYSDRNLVGMNYETGNYSHKQLAKVARTLRKQGKPYDAESILNNIVRSKMAFGNSLPKFRPLPSYQMGGAIGPGGQPMRPAGLQDAAPTGEQMSPQMVEMQIEEFVRTNPQAVQQIQQLFMQGVQSGQLDQQELNNIYQLAMTALRNPAAYPQLRQYAITQGIAAAEDLPPQFDQPLVIAVILAIRSAQAGVGGQNMMQGGTPAMAPPAPALGAPPPGGAMPSMAKGGPIPGGSGSKPVAIEAHEGEYVIPKHVVDMKGREFFDKMLAQYGPDGKDANRTSNT